MFMNFSFGGIVILALIALLASALRILREYERGVVFQLGRFWKVKGPGLVFVIPGSSRWCAWTCARWCWTCPSRT